MSDLRIANTPPPKSSAQVVADIEDAVNQWITLASWATPEAKSAFNHCRYDIYRALGLDVFGQPINGRDQ